VMMSSRACESHESISKNTMGINFPELSRTITKSNEISVIPIWVPTSCKAVLKSYISCVVTMSNAFGYKYCSLAFSVVLVSMSVRIAVVSLIQWFVAA